jgi:ribonuclease HI
VVYTNGSCLHNGTDDAKAGIGLWYAPNDPRNLSLHLPPPHLTNNAGELVAILVATQRAPPLAPLFIISDSTYAIKGLTSHLSSWEDHGWINIPNTDLFRAIASTLRSRSDPTSFIKVQGHSGDPGNNAADGAALAGTLRDTPDDINTHVRSGLQPLGAKLQSMTQALLYKGILSQSTTPERPASRLCLSLVKAGVRSRTTFSPTDRAIWKSVRSKDISCNIRSFLWKYLHNAH